MSDQMGDAVLFLDALRQAYNAQDSMLRKRYHRSLPLQDAIIDRWERAKLLGFEEDVSIYNSALVYGNVTVGRSTWIGPYVILDGSGDELTVGAWCAVSAGVHIYTHDTVAWALSAGQSKYRHGPVSIGDCCYIGSQAVIVAGVTVGARCVIGANSFVSRDVQAETIVGGSPARQIGRVMFDGETPRLVFDRKKIDEV